MLNKKLAEIFDEIADMLDIKGGGNIFFEVRAYRKIALTIGTMQEDIEEIYKKKGIKGLDDLPGVGASTAALIKEFIETGKMKKYEQLKKKYPVDFKELTKIQGMGPKKAWKLYLALKVKNIEDLKKALAQHKIRNLEGFGERSESEMQKGLEFAQNSGKRMLLGTALPEAESIVKKLKDSKLVKEAIVAGSTRRMRETVGDLDILITSDKAPQVMELISKLNEVERILVKGPTKTSVLLKIGLNCDFRVVEQENFGAALQYFTGSKDHGVLIRQIAVRKGYSLNEYQLSDKNGKNIASKTEEEVYNRLGLDYIEPEMREARGEIELAMQHKLPKLIEVKDLKGDLHLHTKFSDGYNTIEEMAQKGIELGYEYIGLTDHSKSEFQARGMDDKKFVNYFGKIDDAIEKLESKITILKSGEVDILKDGSLDLSNRTLEMMDYRSCSIHTSLTLSKEEMTKRVVKAFESGYVDVFCHPTDRLINQREPIPLDFDKVCDAAEKNNVVMEIDSFPDRLDLNDENIIRAREYKLKFQIDTDAHRIHHMDFMRYGVGMAKRGWLTKDDVVNTLPIDKLMKYYKR